MEKLKNLRLKANYTHQDMANFLGISKAFYWQIENKKRTLSYKMAVNIAAIFREMPDNLFYGEFRKEV